MEDRDCRLTGMFMTLLILFAALSYPHLCSYIDDVKWKLETVQQRYGVEPVDNHVSDFKTEAEIRIRY